MSRRVKVVTLLANWFSGATLFTILLDAHSQIVTNGEALPFTSHDFTEYECSCGKYVKECWFYQAAAKHMKSPASGGWNRELFVQVPPFSNNVLVQSFLGSARWHGRAQSFVIDAVPRYRRIRDRFVDAQLQFYANALEISGSSIYLDGTKSIRRSQLLARDAHCDMKVLHLIRDGRAFCCSYIRNNRLTTNHLRRAAKQWLNYIQLVDIFTKTFPSIPVLNVRYEDLCTSTRETLQHVFQFLEVPYEDIAVRSMENLHILGNRMRRTFRGEIVEDTSWRREFDSSTEARITFIMKPELKRFGYL